MRLLDFYIRQGDGWEREQGIFVSRVVLGTDVDVFELLRVGDEIIRVNKVDVRTMTIQDVSALMQMTRRLILTVKVLTPVTAMAVKRLAMNKDNNIQGLKSLSPRTSRPSRSEASMDSASNSSRQSPDRRVSSDRRLSNTSSLSHQANYKVANLVIGKKPRCDEHGKSSVFDALRFELPRLAQKLQVTGSWTQSAVAHTGNVSRYI